MICPAVLRAEARAQHKSARAHWAHMVVHGVLHLVGYDHELPDEARRMERREIRTLRRLGIANPYRRSADRYGQGTGDKSGGKKAGASGRWRSRFTRTLAAGVKDRAQLVEMLAESQQRGVLDADPFAMLEGAFAVADLQVRDIMVPRTQMVCVGREDPIARILSAVVESRHSRFPVLGSGHDDVAGILLAKDLLRLFAGEQETFDMREYLRPAVFVPEAKRLNVLLSEFRDNRNHMAIVVDEYGGVAGLVTIEDVIEQIVGDIDDEFDVEDDQNIRREGERQFSVRGTTRIDEFNQFFSAELRRRIRHGRGAGDEAARTHAAPGRSVMLANSSFASCAATAAGSTVCA